MRLSRLSIATTAVVACTALSVPAHAAALTKLHATATHAFVDPSGATRQVIGPNVQPILDPGTNDTWGQDTYTKIKSKGFTAVRFVLFWKDFQPTEADWNETAFDTLSTAVDRAKAAGLYIVLDCAHLSGDHALDHVPDWAYDANDPDRNGWTAVVDNGLGFLKTIAERYKDEPEIAAYDPVNEPSVEVTDSTGLLSGYTRIVDAIRTNDPKTNIMLEPQWGDAKVPSSAFASFTPGSRANLIWSFHDYYTGNPDPDYGTDGYKDNGESLVPNASDGTTGYNAAWKNALGKHLQVQLDLAAAQKMPVWIGEMGIGNGAAAHDQFIKDKVALYKAKGVDYAWWEYYANGGDGPFSMVDSGENWRSWVGLLV